MAACRTAAANEARIRKAPEVTLDHLLLGLLQDGTDTSAFLDGYGVDRNEWRRRLDESLTRYDEGPRWPPNARDFGMSHPGDGMETVFKKEIPDDVDIFKLTREERREYIDRKPGTVRFTDIMWLSNVPREEKTLAHKLFEEAGITDDAIRAELQARKTGNREWFKVRPDLAEQLHNPDLRPIGVGMSMVRSIEGAAQYEARLRWAPTLEFEHILLALLVDRTETAEFLNSLGVDRAELADALDKALPKFDSGPFFPKQQGPSILFDVYLLAPERPSDLKVIEGMFILEQLVKSESPSVGLAMLEARGVTLESVQSRLDSLGVPIRRLGRA